MKPFAPPRVPLVMVKKLLVPHDVPVAVAWARDDPLPPVDTFQPYCLLDEIESKANFPPAWPVTVAPFCWIKSPRIVNVPGINNVPPVLTVTAAVPVTP